jgi:hypothetical protein
MKNPNSINDNEENTNDDFASPSHMGIHEHDLSGGGEFLNDGMRMHEQPLSIREIND